MRCSIARPKNCADRLPEDHLALACQLYEEMITAPEPPDFLTLRAYEYLD